MTTREAQRKTQFHADPTRTEKIGLRDFLHQSGAPEIKTSNAPAERAQTDRDAHAPAVQQIQRPTTPGATGIPG